MFVSEIYDEALEILGTTDQTKVFTKLTQAVQALMESGHWFHTVDQVDVCTGWDGVTITLPRGVEVPLSVNVDGSPTYFRGKLFQFHVNKGGMYNTVEWAWDDRGFVSTIMDIRQPSQLIAVAESDSDAGKTLRVLGTDLWNRDLRSQLPDGTGVDGLIVPIHSQHDFVMGAITPDSQTIDTRSVSITPITEFLSSADHQFSTGQSVKLTSSSGVPSFLVNGSTYYVGVIDTKTVQLFATQLDAQNNQYPIQLQNTGSSSVHLIDSRPSNLATVVHLNTVPSSTVNNANEVTFSVSGSQTLPAPLSSGLTYFANPLAPEAGDTGLPLQIYSTLTDAENLTNPVVLSNVTTSQQFTVNVRQGINPQTTLVFPPPGHNFFNGDTVQANSNGGTLPEPLVAGVNYYAHVINSLTITLHLTESDALAGDNAIILTTQGSGNNAILKLVPASVVIGAQSNNISAPDFNIPSALGSGATGRAIVVGSVTGVTPTQAGSYTPASYASVTFTIAAPTGALSGGVTATCTPNWAQYFDSSGGSYYTLVSFNIINNGSGYLGTNNLTVTVGGSGVVYTSPVGDTNPAPGRASTANAQVTTSFVDHIEVLTGGSGYTGAVPYVTITPNGGVGSGATAIATVSSAGVVTGFTQITQGTGYTQAPKVDITPSTGVYIQFATTGTYPSYTVGTGTTIVQMTQGTAYRAEQPSTSSSFSLTDALGNKLTMVSNGTGNLYVVVSRALTVSWNNAWSGDFNGLSSGQKVNFGTDYLLPITTPAIDTVSNYYLRKLSSNTGKFFTTSGQATFTYNTIAYGGPGVQYFDNSGGFNYSGAITVSIAPPPQITFSTSSTGTTIGTLSVSGGGLGVTQTNVPYTRAGNVVTITLNSGIGITSSPITISSATDTGLNGSVTVLTGITAGASATLGTTHLYSEPGYSIASITVTRNGSGYSAANPPVVTITNPGGQGVGAFANAIVNSATGSISSVNLSSLITVSSFGTGQSYFSIPTLATADVYNNYIKPNSVQFLKAGMSVALSSTGTVPSTLPTGPYKISPVGEYVQLLDSSNNVVAFTSLGVGQLFLDFDRVFNAQPSDSIQATNSLLNTGDSVVVRPAQGDTLPGGLSLSGAVNQIIMVQPGSYTLDSALPTVTIVNTDGTGAGATATPVFVTSPDQTYKYVAFMTVTNGGANYKTNPIVQISGGTVYVGGTAPGVGCVATASISNTYYVHRSGDPNSFQLYQTLAQATSGGLTGLITYSSTGNTVSSTFFVDAILPATLVKSVSHVEKPLTSGYVSLYAYDYGRSNDMALIGQYHPTEVNPKYRRIRIGKSCSWARILYRVKAPVIGSLQDYIPIEQTRAILTALHAIDLEDKDFIDQATKYWALALQYLKSQQNNMDGHSFVPPQVNNITYGDGTDWVMF